MRRLENPRSYGCWRKPATATPTSPTGRPTARGWTLSSRSTSRNQVGGGAECGRGADSAQTLGTSETEAPPRCASHPQKCRVLGEILCEAVPKVPEALRAPFWHFCHPEG